MTDSYDLKWCSNDRFGHISPWALVLCEMCQYIKTCWWRHHCLADNCISFGCNVSIDCMYNIFFYFLFFFDCTYDSCMYLNELSYATLSVFYYMHFRWSIYRYDGSIGSASRAMAAMDQLVWQLSRRSLWTLESKVGDCITRTSSFLM